MGVPDYYHQTEPTEEVRKALLSADRGVWGLDKDGTPLFYPCGGVVTTFRKKTK